MAFANETKAIIREITVDELDQVCQPFNELSRARFEALEAGNEAKRLAGEIRVVGLAVNNALLQPTAGDDSAPAPTVGPSNLCMTSTLTSADRVFTLERFKEDVGSYLADHARTMLKNLDTPTYQDFLTDTLTCLTSHEYQHLPEWVNDQQEGSDGAHPALHTPDTLGPSLPGTNVDASIQPGGSPTHIDGTDTMSTTVAVSQPITYKSSSGTVFITPILPTDPSGPPEPSGGTQLQKVTPQHYEINYEQPVELDSSSDEEKRGYRSRSH